MSRTNEETTKESEISIVEARALVNTYRDFINILYVSSSPVIRENVRIKMHEMKLDRMFKYALRLVREAETEETGKTSQGNTQPATEVPYYPPYLRDTTFSLCSSNNPSAAVTPRPIFPVRSKLDDEVATITSLHS